MRFHSKSHKSHTYPHTQIPSQDFAPEYVTFTPFASNSAMVSCQRTGGIVLSAKRVSHALPSVRPSPRRSQLPGAAAEVRHQKATGVRSPAGGDRFGRARGHNLSSVPSTFRSKIDDVVGRLDDIEIVLDDDDGIAVIAQSMEDF